MAFGDLVGSAATGSGASGTASAVLGAGATAGNLILYGQGRSAARSDIANVLPPSGFTQLDVGFGNVEAHWAYKIATGGETTITEGDSSGAGNWSAFAVEIAGPFASPAFDVKAEDESNLTTVDTSQPTGTTGATAQNDELIVAFFAADNGGNVTDGRAYTNSLNEVVFANSGARAAAILCKKVVAATGTQTSTFSTTDTGDEMYGAIAAFKKAAAAAGGNPWYAYAQQ